MAEQSWAAAGGPSVCTGAGPISAAPTLVHAPDGRVLGCQVRPGSRRVWNKGRDLRGKRGSGTWWPWGGMSQARQAAFVHDVDADSSDGGLCSPQGPPHGPLQPHRLPPALPPGGRAVASSRGSGPCHSLHCRISHRRPRIGAGSARSGGGRGRQRKGRKAWRLGGRWRGCSEGLPLPPQIIPGQRHPLCPLAGCSGPRGGSAPSQGHTARLTSCPGSGGSAGRAV